MRLRKSRKIPLKTSLFLLLSLISGPAFAAEKLTVYVYDSFTGKGSLGAFLAEELKKQEKADVRYVPFSTAGEALNQIALEGKKTKADLIIGVDNGLLGRAAEIDLFEPLGKEYFAEVPPTLRFDPALRFVPFDVGFITLLYDSTRPSPLASPLSLKEFAVNPAYAKKVVMADPRTSTVGLGFFLGTRSAFDTKEFETFWKAFSKQVLTITPGWSAAYGMFLKKEADYVLSYTTSPAYHIENEKNNAIKAVVFKEGNYRQIEGAALVAVSANKILARKFLKLLLSEKVQKQVPTLQWMYPARVGVTLPESYAQLPDVLKALDPPPAMTEAMKRDWLRDWSKAAATK